MIKTSFDEEDLIAPLVNFSSLDRSLSLKTTRPNYEEKTISDLAIMKLLHEEAN